MSEKPYNPQTDWPCPATSSSVTPPHKRGHRFRPVTISLGNNESETFLYCERCGINTAGTAPTFLGLDQP